MPSAEMGLAQGEAMNLKHFGGLMALLFLTACDGDDTGHESGETDTNVGEVGSVLINYTFSGGPVECFVSLDGAQVGKTGLEIGNLPAGDHEFSLGELTPDGNWVHDLGSNGKIAAPPFSAEIPEDDLFTTSVAGNRYIEGRWTCERREDADDIWTEPTVYTDGRHVYLPRLGILNVDGEQVDFPDDGNAEVFGAFTSPTTLTAVLHRTDGSNAVRTYDCWAGEEWERP